MTRRLALAVLLILACGAQKTAAQANCASLVVTNLNFGTYTGTLLTGVTPGTVNCNNGQTWSIGFNAGMGAGATETIRKMTGPGGAELSYQLFRDAARTLNWGDTEGVDTLQGTGTGRAQTINVYAQVVAAQYVAQGTYTDTVSSATTSFTLTVVVQATCTISANNLNFGNFSGSLIDSTSIISVNCTKAATYNVGLNAGTAPGATVTNRSMTGPGAALLGYKLFSNSTYTTNWGNTVGTNTVAGTGSGSAQPLTVYGQIPAAQSAMPGSYSDTITATITY
jgi:spore coat protein U-like protein